MSYADMVLAIVPAAAPAKKKFLATSCPAPISTIVPYFFSSKLRRKALSLVERELTFFSMMSPNIVETDKG